MRHAKGLCALAFALTLSRGVGLLTEVAHHFDEPPIDSYSMSVFQVRIDGNTEPLDGATVSHDSFKTAQVRPLVGACLLMVISYRRRNRSS